MVLREQGRCVQAAVRLHSRPGQLADGVVPREKGVVLQAQACRMRGSVSFRQASRFYHQRRQHHGGHAHAGGGEGEVRPDTDLRGLHGEGRPGRRRPEGCGGVLQGPVGAAGLGPPGLHLLPEEEGRPPGGGAGRRRGRGRPGAHGPGCEGSLGVGGPPHRDARGGRGPGPVARGRGLVAGGGGVLPVVAAAVRLHVRRLQDGAKEARRQVRRAGACPHGREAGRRARESGAADPPGWPTRGGVKAVQQDAAAGPRRLHSGRRDQGAPRRRDRLDPGPVRGQWGRLPPVAPRARSRSEEPGRWGELRAAAPVPMRAAVTDMVVRSAASDPPFARRAY
mmetsp:Transcript_84316/g.239137  ORF Transcript_84316/g.239137 Transcript_84316/m.239137 type:complete len:337 (+) Transcript_84316:412-1422(+)